MSGANIYHKTPIPLCPTRLQDKEVLGRFAKELKMKMNQALPYPTVEEYERKLVATEPGGNSPTKEIK